MSRADHARGELAQVRERHQRLSRILAAQHIGNHPH